MSNDTTSKRAKASAIAALLAIGGTAPLAQAQDREWKFEITPYLWAAGIDADVTVGSQTAAGAQTVKVDKSFSDILDAVDIAGDLLVVAQYGHAVFWGQADYLSLTSDNLDDAPSRGSLDTEAVMATAGIGYQFDGWKEGQSFDVLIGARHLTLKNTLKLDALGTFKSDKDFTDPVIILRPSLRLSKRWRFNPTLSYGTGGDSEKTYELQPQFQFQMSEHWAMRFGYRRLYYDIKAESGNRFDGAFQGLIIGIGGTFGSKPVPRVAERAPEPAPAAKPAPPPPPPPPPRDTDGDGVADNIDKCPSTPRGEKVDPVGCGYNVRLNVLFDTNSAELPSSSHAELDRLVDAINSTPTLFVVVEGHTDSNGTAAHNQQLSERRAKSVVDYLAAHGISSNRLQWKGYGESQPIADNTTEEGRAQNRRVVLRRPDAD